MCLELGFKDGKAMQRNSLGAMAYGSLTTLGAMTNVNCTGAEASFSHCHSEDHEVCEFDGSVIKIAAVICYNKSYEEVESRKLTSQLLSQFGI